MRKIKKTHNQKEIFILIVVNVNKILFYFYLLIFFIDNFNDIKFI